MADFIENSKKTWASDGTTTTEHINVGSLQRIAAATELMTTNYSQLIFNVEHYKIMSKANYDLYKKSLRTIAALRGVITKLKRKRSKNAKTSKNNKSRV